MKIKKPPIGIIPVELWKSDRKYQLSAAIVRYANEGLKIPIKWVEEFNEMYEIKKEPVKYKYNCSKCGAAYKNEYEEKTIEKMLNIGFEVKSDCCDAPISINE